MKTLTRCILLVLLLAVATLSLPNRRLAAQGAGAATGDEASGEQAPEAFVPTEKLPADAAVSFPIDI